MICGSAYKSYCLACHDLRNPIQIILSCLPWFVESYPNSNVLSAMICGITSKSYCLVCHDLRNHIQILMSCLPLFAESHPNNTVLSAIICRIPSKSYCLICHDLQNPNGADVWSWLCTHSLVLIGLRQRARTQLARAVLLFSIRYHVSQSDFCWKLRCPVGLKLFPGQFHPVSLN